MGGLRGFIREFVGTFALTFAAAAGLALLSPLGGAAAYAAAACAVYFAFPGAPTRFNPALTIAEIGLHRLDWLHGVLALGAQLLGAACAGIFLRAVLINGHPELLGAPRFLGACYPSGIGFRAATLIEAVMTFFLGCAAYATTERRRRPFGPMAMGCATLFGAAAAGPLTGGAMNPARAFGSAIAAGYWNQHYVYWAGPLAGAVLAAIVSPYLVSEEHLP